MPEYKYTDHIIKGSEAHAKLNEILDHLINEHGLDIKCDAISELHWIIMESIDERVVLGKARVKVA